MTSLYPPVVIPQTETWAMRDSAPGGQEYSIRIALPPNEADADKSPATLYMLDASWLFDMTANIVRLLGLAGEIPPLLIAGIAYPDAWFDTPQRAHDYAPQGWVDDPRSGGADKLLRFIRDDLMPRIGAQYRVDPRDRCFWGDSLGGLFGLYVMLNQPDTFTRYVLGSPWIDREGDEILRCESAYAASHVDLPARLFMGAGALEFPFLLKNIARLADTLRGRQYASLKLSTQVFAGEGHVIVMPFNLSRGMRAVFEAAG